jgi:hypothetical protein
MLACLIEMKAINNARAFHCRNVSGPIRYSFRRRLRKARLILLGLKSMRGDRNAAGARVPVPGPSPQSPCSAPTPRSRSLTEKIPRAPRP